MAGTKVRTVNEQYQGVADRLNMIRDNEKKKDEKGKVIPGRITQKDMASIAGCSLPAWSEYECGKALPTPKVLQALVLADYDANWILCGKGSMKIGDSQIDKTSLGTIIIIVLAENEKAGSKLTADGIANTIAIAYKNYRNNFNAESLRTQIAELIQLAVSGMK